MKYTTQQQTAIDEIDRNLQIIACAGSGKTQVISARTVNILSQPGILPRNIVAFTFTNKAAAELKYRITRMAEDELGEIEGMAEMYVGTIHGYCLQFLQDYLFKFLKYSVLSDVQNNLLVARNSQKSGLKQTELLNDKGCLSRGSRDVKIFVEIMNVVREDHVDFDELPKPIVTALEMYTQLLDEHRYLDYSRIQLEAVQALTDTEDESCLKAQKKIADQIKYVIVDEYQDVNPLQEDLIRRLHDLGAKVCVVGDDDQTIYQWRGSEVRNILEFEDRYPDVKTVKMGDNFRSSRAVVDAGRQIAETNIERLPKPAHAAGHQPYDRGDLLALRFDGPEEEAQWIADKIRKMRGVVFEDRPNSPGRGLTWSDCAILLRSVKNSAGPIIEALNEADIPYIVKGFSNLFDNAEVQAAVRLFDYVAGEAEADDVREAWHDANLGLTEEDLERGLDVLDKASDWERETYWSQYNIQRVYLDFLEAVSLIEERIPSPGTDSSRGELVLSNLGKFSQVISDFEQIHFQSEPSRKYESFHWWLKNEAPEHYEAASEADGYAQPDAVQIMTVHQAKGMEWPVVFVPALLRNRFPAAGQGGRNKWHVLPKELVENAGRYDGTDEDERRLFYVALTRSKKYLFCSYGPIEGKNNLYKYPSILFQEFKACRDVLTRDLMPRNISRTTPQAHHDNPPVVLSFSELKYLFECPYQFKMRFFYGFNPPIHEALGYGKSLHDALAEIHKRAVDGDIIDEEEIADLVRRHLHVPFAYPDLRDSLRSASHAAIERYVEEHGETLERTLHSEKQIEVQIEPGITVNGRVDLIKRLDTDEVSIIDFKSTHRAQDEELTREQLHTYALGYLDLNGEPADRIEIHNLDQQKQEDEEFDEAVTRALLERTRERIRRAGNRIRRKKFERIERDNEKCESCDFKGICRSEDLEKA